MGLVVFEIHKKGKKSMKSLNREILWYEWAKKDEDGNVVEAGKMHRMQGGRLDFKYDPYEKKLNVGTAGLKVTSYETESNEKEIDSWVKANAVELQLTQSKTDGIVVNFPDKKKDAVKKALEETSFSYEIV